MADGGYDDGYGSCDCFWGNEPSSLILKLSSLLDGVPGLNVLDVGAGEGKNAIYMAGLGANVTAIECSSLALRNAKKMDGSERVNWMEGDIRSFDLHAESFDVVVAYGLLHCLRNAEEIAGLAEKLQIATKQGGYHVVCTFNSRYQDFQRAHPGFSPCLLPHLFYEGLYSDWLMLECTDRDLIETHPNNGIEHTHSMTRVIARKAPNGR